MKSVYLCWNYFYGAVFDNNLINRVRTHVNIFISKLGVYIGLHKGRVSTKVLKQVSDVIKLVDN